MEEYLLAVEGMQTPPQKLKNVLQFLGVRVETESDVHEYLENPHKLMVLPKFIDSFANASYSPLMVGDDEATNFAKEIKQKVKYYHDDDDDGDDDDGVVVGGGDDDNVDDDDGDDDDDVVVNYSK